MIMRNKHPVYYYLEDYSHLKVDVSISISIKGSEDVGTKLGKDNLYQLIHTIFGVVTDGQTDLRIKGQR